MYIFSYFDFILEKIEDRFPFIYSNEVKSKLEEINSPISLSLSEFLHKPYQYSMVSIGKSKDTITFITADKLVKRYPEVDEGNLNDIIDDDIDWSDGSIEMKVGRFVKRLLGDKFKDSEIEEFVNKWKSTFGLYKFEIWDGERIKEAYSSVNYTQDGSGHSQLMCSCMNDQLHLIDFYVYSSVKVLVLLDKSGHITGRSLVWKDYKDRLIMDRVYFTWDSDYHKFTKYARDNGWYYKKSNISGYSTLVDSSGDEHEINTKVRVLNVDSMMDDNLFPYMDTFYYAAGNYAMNYEPDSNYIKMQSTDGTYEEISNEQDVHGDDIDNINDYEYSKTQDGYVSRDNSVNVSYDSRGYGDPYSFDDWIELDYLMYKRNGFLKLDGIWYKKDHCVWSERENSWIFRPDAVYSKNDWIHYDNFNVNN